MGGIADALGDGTPYFYLSLMDTPIKDLQGDSRCTLSLSEAAIDCQTLQLDPEDPRCLRLTISGLMVNTSDKDEEARAKAALFKMHPSMESWPADHQWIVTKLQIQHILLLDFYGGLAHVPLANYSAVTQKFDLVPINATHMPSQSKPAFAEKAATARWLAHESRWGVLATTNTNSMGYQLHGIPFGNPISVSDGTLHKSTGIPYFYTSDLDVSLLDLKKYPNCTLVLSGATVDCREQTLDPADPHCVRLSLSGAITTVIDPDELIPR